MSTFLAIGATTRAIAELLTRKLNKPPRLGAGTAVRVTTLPPDDDRVGAETGLNLYLYRVAESPFHKNDPWRGDRAHRDGAARAPLALTLSYLLTAYAQKMVDSFQDDVVAHQLLGNAMALLHEHPVLNDVHDGDFDADVDAQLASELRDSFEKLKVTLAPASLDDFSKIWTGLSKAYRLSVAYEVSLIEIAPALPSPRPAPPPQRALVHAVPLSAPAIMALAPQTGPVGTRVTITGVALRSATGATTVWIGDERLPAAAIESALDDRVVFVVPDAPAGGPRLGVAVEASGRRSAAATFEVRPWLSALRPLRGTTGIPLRLEAEVPPGPLPQVTLAGIPAVVALGADGALVATVPEVPSSGPAAVVVSYSGGARSNGLSYEVLPHVSGVQLTTVGPPARTTVAVQGVRLAGGDVYVRYAGVLLHKGGNADAVSVSVAAERALPAGAPVSVIVDGRESNVLPPRLDAVDPPQAVRGDAVALLGAGLSGASVRVRFGVSPVDLGAQPYAGRVEATVPDGVPTGPIDVTVEVDGSSSAAVTLIVKA